MSYTRDSTPILMYHSVGWPIGSKCDRFLNVSAEGFRRQIRALNALGFSGRTFGEVVDAMRQGKELPPRSIAITFDDAYQCVGETAAPVLHQHGYLGTLFVVSNWTGAPETTGVENGRRAQPVMDWHALERLAAEGWEIGGHTATHPHLDQLEDTQAFDEILEGKTRIERKLGILLHTFCYPFGHFNGRTPSLVRAAGFAGACTVRSGLATSRTNPLMLPRVKVGYRDGVTGLLYRLLVRPSLPTFRRHRRCQPASLQL